MCQQAGTRAGWGRAPDGTRAAYSTRATSQVLQVILLVTELAVVSAFVAAA